ncbi:MAG: exo-alpha-sialidase [Paenibacillaceae bacterium]|nr:exo-alpha-sialidase [Paenibacillaceae bacterium]
MTESIHRQPYFQVNARGTSFARVGLFPLGATIASCPHPNDPARTRWVQLMNLFEGSDRGVGVLCRISDDKGHTWRETGVFDRAYRFNAEPAEKLLKLQNGCIYDERSGAIIRFVTEYVWKEGSAETILDSILRKRRIYYCLSFDSGETWTDACYIYQEGGGYDRDTMFPGVTFGQNMIMPAMPIIVRGAGMHKGDIAVGVQIQMVDEAGTLINPTIMGFFKSACLFGNWNADEGRYMWTMSANCVEVSVGESTRGLYEPSLCECDDGRLIMLLRGSNTKAREHMPGTKWISVSDDQGVTWSKPFRLCYDDGSLMYSSSSLSCLVRDTAGTFYYVGIVNGDNPDGNLPRYPLCAARLHTDTLTIERASVTTIVTKQAQHDEAAGVHPVDYSNHSALWDDEEDKLVMFVPLRPDLRKFEGELLCVELTAKPHKRQVGHG